MKKCLLILSCLSIVLVSMTLAREIREVAVEEKQQNQPAHALQTRIPSIDHTMDFENELRSKSLHATTQFDTTWLASYTFDGGGYCISEGWISHDMTEQTGCYFHVDDFAGLGGGDFGRLVSLEGAQSIWCGTRPDSTSEILCGYATLPGYGNYWDQSWCSPCFETEVVQPIHLDYLIMYDSEPGYDYTYVEYAEAESCEDLASVDSILTWNVLAAYDDYGTATAHDTIPSGHGQAVRVRFHFVSDVAWSDEDGIWGTDGAVIIDSVTVRQGASLVSFDDYEDETPGDLQAIAFTPPSQDSVWTCREQAGYGDFASLYAGASDVVGLQGYPCSYNASCLWDFIDFSIGVVPFGNFRGQYIDNEIWSPKIPWTGSGSTAELRWDTFRDLPVNNCVFYKWRVRSWLDGCPGPWKDRNWVYNGTENTWVECTEAFSDLVEPGASHIQVALGVVDMFSYFGFCTGAIHAASPLFDNVEVYRTTTGPQWDVSAYLLFQDTFSEDGTLSGTGRADIALDILSDTNPNIQPGDSVVAKVTDPDDIAAGPNNCGSAIYCYVSVLPSLYPANEIEAPEVGVCQGVNGLRRYPVVGSIQEGTDFWGKNPDRNLTWYMIQMDTVFVLPNRQAPSLDRYCVDLNDNLFVPGDTILFFFGAENQNGLWSYWSEFTGHTFSRSEAANDPMEFQVLPAVSGEAGDDILYVDKYDGLGAQPYFDTSFEFLQIEKGVDRYDVRAPSTLMVSNGPDSRANVITQLIPSYRKIIWNSGDLQAGTTLGCPFNGSAKDSNATMLYEFLSEHTNTNGCGIYLSGDDIAAELSAPTTGPGAAFLKSEFINFVLTSDDHRYQGLLISSDQQQGHPVSPLSVGTPGSMFDHTGAGGFRDTLVVYGGCPNINDFDVMQAIGYATCEMTYMDSQLAYDQSVVAQSSINSHDTPVRVVLSGFSYHFIRDDRPAGIPDRVEHLTHIIRYLANIIDDPTHIGTSPAFANSLAQNYPNPFNPSTTIKYSIQERAHVSLKIYNVAGQLVKTLVNGEMKPGAYAAQWHGRSDAGNPVSSGVYFYKLVTKDFTATKKMILIK